MSLTVQKQEAGSSNQTEAEIKWRAVMFSGAFNPHTYQNAALLFVCSELTLHKMMLPLLRRSALLPDLDSYNAFYFVILVSIHRKQRPWRKGGYFIPIGKKYI